MPCIIYRVSYENELKGKICPLLGAFSGFGNASGEKVEGSRMNPCQPSSAAGKRKERERASRDPAGGIFDPLFQLHSAQWLFFWFYELQTLEKIKDGQKVRKKIRRQTRGEHFVCESDLIWWNMISPIIYTATIFQTNHCHPPPPKNT